MKQTGRQIYQTVMPILWLLAFMALLALATLRPELEVSLLGNGSKDNLQGLNRFVLIERTGFSSLQSDESSGKTFQRIAIDTPATVRLAAFSYHPVRLKLGYQGGSLQVKANGQSLSTLPVTAAFKEYQLEFTPASLDNDGGLFIVLSFTGAAQISNATLDFSNQWQPFLSDSTYLSALVCGLLVVLLVFSLLPHRLKTPIAGIFMLAIGLSLSGISFTLAGQTLTAGFSGELNAGVFWLLIVSALYLAMFGLIHSLVTAPVLWNNGDSVALYPILKTRWDNLQIYKPTAAATLVLIAANTGLMILLYSVPLVTNGGWAELARYWDGPGYLLAAKTFYDPHDSMLALPGFSKYSNIYWSAHFPGYVLLIRALSPLFGYIAPMFIINYVATIIFGVTLYRLLKDFGYSTKPLWLSVLFLFLPLRWLLYHSVGASEGMALMFIVLSFYAFKKRQWWWAGLWGAGLVVTRANGIFMLGGYGLYLLWEARIGLKMAQPKPVLARISGFIVAINWRAVAGLSLMPLALVAVFSLYASRYGDFFAYIKIPEDVKHVYPIPLLSLAVTASRSEGNFYYYIIEAAGLALLWRRKLYDLFWLGLVFFVPTLFMLHDDILRYSLPAFPFVLIAPYARVLESKIAYYIAPVALLGVLIYSWTQLGFNKLEGENWQQMLELLK
ncbi:hypothetical protein [Candidatus Chlorohelix sp.]|uniref:hypothetical protein n=1 Tax=Candidatus Chlorohelix sp. TaxID=3139201 RepID=UPI00305DD081